MLFDKSKALLAGAVVAFCVGQVSTATAKEGMFTPDQLPEISKDLRKTGLKIKPKNHHCSRGSVQYNSTEENNYLEDGFLAKSLKDELPASPGSRVYVIFWWCPIQTK